jgi:hypothetical protein
VDEVKEMKENEEMNHDKYALLLRIDLERTWLKQET